MPDVECEPRGRNEYRDALLLIVLALVLMAVFSLVHRSSPLLFGIDAYFHVKYSQLLRTEGMIWDFPWLAFTIYTRNFADDHFLFHCLLIPVTFGDLVSGAKLYATVMATLVFLAFYLLLRKGGIRFPLLWTGLLLVCSHTFLMRMCMARAPSASLLVLLIGTGIILRRRDRWIGPLAFLYVWLYGGFPLLGVLVVVAFIASLLAEGEARYGLLVSCVLGMAAGLIINPYFPHNVQFLYTSYTQIELGNFPGTVSVGNEGYPYAASTAVRKTLLLWPLIFGVILLYMVRPRMLEPNALVLFLFSIVFLCLYLKVRRYIEYWPPFAVLFSAYALNPFLRDLFLDRVSNSRKWISLGTVLLVLGVTGAHAFGNLIEDMSRARKYQRYTNAAHWLRDHTAPGELVFNADWGDFPILFHFNTHNRYIVGMDPAYFYLFDGHRYDRWIKIGEGKEATPGKAILEDFGARYLFTFRDEDKLLESLNADPSMQVAFEDEYALVYRIEGAKQKGIGQE